MFTTVILALVSLSAPLEPCSVLDREVEIESSLCLTATGECDLYVELECHTDDAFRALVASLASEGAAK